MHIKPRLVLATVVGAVALTAPPALAADAIHVTAPQTVNAGKVFTVTISGNALGSLDKVWALVQYASKPCPGSLNAATPLVVNRNVASGQFRFSHTRRNAATKKIVRRFCAYLLDSNDNVLASAHADYALRAAKK